MAVDLSALRGQADDEEPVAETPSTWSLTAEQPALDAGALPHHDGAGETPTAAFGALFGAVPDAPGAPAVPAAPTAPTFEAGDDPISPAASFTELIAIPADAVPPTAEPTSFNWADIASPSTASIDASDVHGVPMAHDVPAADSAADVVAEPAAYDGLSSAGFPSDDPASAVSPSDDVPDDVVPVDPIALDTEVAAPRPVVDHDAVRADDAIPLEVDDTPAGAVDPTPTMAWSINDAADDDGAEAGADEAEAPTDAAPHGAGPEAGAGVVWSLSDDEPAPAGGAPAWDLSGTGDGDASGESDVPAPLESQADSDDDRTADEPDDVDAMAALFGEPGSAPEPVSPFDDTATQAWSMPADDLAPSRDASQEPAVPEEDEPFAAASGAETPTVAYTPPFEAESTASAGEEGRAETPTVAYTPPGSGGSEGDDSERHDSPVAGPTVADSVAGDSAIAVSAPAVSAPADSAPAAADNVELAPTAAFSVPAAAPAPAEPSAGEPSGAVSADGASNTVILGLTPSYGGATARAVTPIDPKNVPAAWASAAPGGYAPPAASSAAPPIDSDPDVPVRGGGSRRPWLFIGIIVAFLVVLAVLFFFGRTIATGGSSAPVPAPVATTSSTPSATTKTTPSPSSTPTPTTTAAAGPAAPGTHPWNELTGGECLSAFTDAWQATYDVVDCGGSHVAQLVSTGKLDGAAGSTYPGSDALQAQVSGACQKSTAINISAAQAYTDLQISDSYPSTAAEWASGARDYYCFASRSGGQAIASDLAP